MRASGRHVERHLPNGVGSVHQHPCAGLHANSNRIYLGEWRTNESSRKHAEFQSESWITTRINRHESHRYAPDSTAQLLIKVTRAKRLALCTCLHAYTNSRTRQSPPHRQGH